MVHTGTQPADRTLHWVDNNFFGNNLGQKLRKQKARRVVAMTGVLFSVAAGFVIGFAAWSFIAPNPVSSLEKFLSAVFWLALFSSFLIPPLVQLAVGSVVALPDQPYDERQKQLFIEARSKAFGVSRLLMALIIVIGLGMLIAVIAGYLPWSHPVYGGLHLFVGVSGTFLMLSSLSPYLILAWQLPDELDGDDDESSND